MNRYNELDIRAVKAAADDKEFESLLTDFRPFMWSRASKLAATQSNRDELMDAAINAFYEAVKGYDSSKGHFYKYMSNAIHMRLIDQWRKISAQAVTIPLEDQRDDENPNISPLQRASLKAYDDFVRQHEIIDEIEEFKTELEAWELNIEKVAEHSPKHTKTRLLYRRIVDQAAAESEILHIIKSKHYFPVKKICDLTKQPPKIIERARIYILAALIIRMGDYRHLKGYVEGGPPR